MPKESGAHESSSWRSQAAQPAPSKGRVSMVNFSCHPVPGQRQGPAPTSLMGLETGLCSSRYAPCLAVVSERRENQERPKAPRSRCLTPCPYRGFLSLLPRPRMRPIKGNISGNSTCSNHPTQSQAHCFSQAGGHPVQPSSSQTSTPHPFRCHYRLLVWGGHLPEGREERIHL